MRTTVFQSGKLILSMLMATAAALAMPSMAGAVITPITVPNFSFESLVALDNATNSATDWSSTGTGGSVFNPNHIAFAGTDGNAQGVLPDGSQDGLITTYSGGELGGSYSQTVGTVAPLTSYTLTVAVGTRLDITSGGWTIELLAGSNIIASNTSNSGPASGTWEDEPAMSLKTGDIFSDPNVGQPLVIEILGFNAPGNTATAQDQFDNVRLISDSPEPASIMLLGGGALALLRRRRGGRA